MSKMNDLSIDIETLYHDGVSVEQIAKTLNCPLSVIVNFIDSLAIEDFSPFDTCNS